MSEIPAPAAGETAPAQRIIKIRRDYNTWVADETVEDYALRFTARSFRKWSEFRVANTALGAIAFLALEAIGGSIALNYGFVNAFWAIVAVGLIIFLTGLPIARYAARYGVDMDLLTRGAGFGYIGSTLTSLIYASFTFIFFAIEAAIMALALELYFAVPLYLGYLICSLAVIPLVTHGITLISRLQGWTQLIWLVMLALPYVFVFARHPDIAAELRGFAGRDGDGGFDLLLFGAASTVVFSLIAQIGEQVDFLRFLPERGAHNRRRWNLAMLSAGPGWIVLGALKLLGGALLAYLALRHGVAPDKAVEPTQMYRVGFEYVFGDARVALGAAVLFVLISQIKINVTNAYAGSLAWSNFFARVTHSHPGRVVWLVFNVLIAVVLMELGVFHALEQILGLYASVAIAWVGALVADLVVNKPLGLSPPGIEFKRAHLYDINPVGVGAMLIASVVAVIAFAGAWGETAQAFSSFIALGTAFVCAPLIAVLTRGRYYIARAPSVFEGEAPVRCVICEKQYEREDMARCPAYGGAICSLCCSLDARCHDACKPKARFADQIDAALQRLLPRRLSSRVNTRLGHYLLLLLVLAVALAAILGLIYLQETLILGEAPPAAVAQLRLMFQKVYAVLLLVLGVGAWWVVLTAESRAVAQQESNRQTHLLTEEIEAHKRTDAELQHAKLAAERANQAKSRYVSGISHELRTPLNSILGYAQWLEQDEAQPRRVAALRTIRRSGEHLVSLIDGLLDIARIEAGKLTLDSAELRLRDFLDQIAAMFRLDAEKKGIRFVYTVDARVPAVVRVDKKRLGQILINMLGNAVKFTERGEVGLRVSCRGEMTVFEIRDTGSGIAAEDLARVFLPFERGPAAGADALEGGTGLGLTIAKMLSDLMGGELGVESRPGQGSLFQLRLLLSEVRNPAPAPLADAADAPASARGESRRDDHRRFAGRRLLIVDNEAGERELLTQLLAPLGFVVEQAASGLDCLRQAPLFRPDLILLDIGMPGLDGWETSRLLRVNRISDAPILVVSANAFDRGRDNEAGIGLEDFIVKPVDVAALLARIRVRLAPPAAGAGPSPEASLRLPPAARLLELRRLGRAGYIRGVIESLDALERQDAAYAPFAARLRRWATGFELRPYLRYLDEVIAHDAER